jgi:hypothetical protein
VFIGDSFKEYGTLFLRLFGDMSKYFLLMAKFITIRTYTHQTEASIFRCKLGSEGVECLINESSDIS